MILQTKIDLVRHAMREAEKAIEEGNYPFGAVLAKEDGAIIFSAHNTQESTNDPTAHAEINLIRIFSHDHPKGNMDGLYMASNAESCSMCFSAAIKVGITHYIFGAPSEDHMDPYLTVSELASYSQKKLDITRGVLAEECKKQIAQARQKQGKLAQ